MILTNQTPIYVIHYTPLVERKIALEKELRNLGFFDITWVTEKTISRYDIQSMYCPSSEVFESRLENGINSFGLRALPMMSKAEQEVTVQHIEALRLISRGTSEHAVVFEDDVLFKKQFFHRFKSYCSQLPASYDLLYFGEGCGSLHQKRSLLQKLYGFLLKKNVFLRENRQSRYADSYLINKKAAKILHDDLSTFQLPIDWETNIIQQKHSVNIYWAEPTITYQGSSSGRYQSGLR